MSDIEESVKEIEGVAENLDSEKFSAADEIEALQKEQKEAPKRKAKVAQQKVVESHAQLLARQEEERLHEDIKILLNKVAVHHSNISIQERPGLTLKDHFGKTSAYYLDIMDYMRDAPDVFLGGDLNKQKRLLTLLTDPAERNGAMDKIKMERLDPSNYTINR